MSSSSAHSSSGSSSHSDSLLQLENNIKEHEDTFSHHKDILSQPEDALSLRKVAPPYLADALSQPEDSTMSGSDRSRHRNVLIFNISDQNTTISGRVLTEGVTNANFYAIVEIIVIATSEFTLQNKSDITIEKNDSLLRPGNYYINSHQPFEVNNKVLVACGMSLQTGSRVQAFRDAICLRDRRCVITGEEVIADYWRGFEAAHIFPLAYEQYWTDHNYGRWISITPDREGTINSIQNRLLLRSDIHQLFDFYEFSINPFDNYKIVCFIPNSKGIARRHLEQRFLNNPQRPVD